MEQDDGPELGSPRGPIGQRLASWTGSGAAAAEPSSQQPAGQLKSHTPPELEAAPVSAPDTPVRTIDWAAPGSALHSQLRRPSWSPVSDGARSPARLATPPRTAPASGRKPAAKAKPSASSMRERGPRYAFGGRDASAPAGSSIGKRAGQPAAGDPWLAGWKPKPPATPQGGVKEKQKSLGHAFITPTPVMEWACPAPPPAVRTKPAAPVQAEGKAPKGKKAAAKPASPAAASPERRAKASKPAPPPPASPQTPEAGQSGSPSAQRRQAALKRLEQQRDLRRKPANPTSLGLPAAAELAGEESSAAQPGEPQPAAMSGAQRRFQRFKAPPFSGKLATLPGGGQAFGSAEEAGEAAAPGSDGRVMCQGCGRSFAPEAHARHSKICAKVFKKERAAFAAERAAAAPVQQAAAEPDVAPKPKPKPKPKPAGEKLGARPPPLAAVAAVAAATAGADGKKVPKWKTQSAQLRAAMLAARPGALGEAVAVFPGAIVEDQDLVPCPHCGRTFAELTAERHIPRCKETVHKPTRLMAGSGRGAHVRVGRK